MKFITFDRTELLQREINKFLKILIKFCEEKKIKKNFAVFLSHKTKSDQYLPDCYRYIFDCPNILLNSSKAYKDFYYSLDKDFQHDLHRPNMKCLLIPGNKKIIKYVKTILGKDFILK